jgi:hypothetical protein
MTPMTNKPTELVDHVMSLVPQAYADIKLNLSDAVICYGNAEGCVREDGCEDNCLMLATYRKGVEFGATTAHRLASTAPASEDEVERKGFPVLGSQGAIVDWQFVHDHGKQANDNHRQSVERLAERGGLSWCELHAVVHNRKYEKIDTNEAMLAVRSLEARYLAALRPRSEREEIANWLREDAPQWGHEALANAIERGDFKEPGE